MTQNDASTRALARKGRAAELLLAEFSRQSAGTGLLCGGAGTHPEACSGGCGRSKPITGKALPLPRPDNRVTWPICPGNKPIKSGLAPEQNATLKIYNWTAYINPQSTRNFSKKYNCKVKVSTFRRWTRP